MRDADRGTVARMILALYAEDPAGAPVTPAHIDATFAQFAAHPGKGEIRVLECGGESAGYAILARVWSNEAGGDLVWIDELYVDPPFRGRGIGTRFLESLICADPPVGKRLCLEVTPGNRRAHDLYRRMGFAPPTNRHLILKF